MSKTRFWIAIAAVLILAAAIFGAGYLVYQTRGEVISTVGQETFQGGPEGYPYFHMYPRMHIFPFGFGGIFFTFLFICIIFGVVRRIFFPRRYCCGPYMHDWKKHPRHMRPWFYDEDEDASEEEKT